MQLTSFSHVNVRTDNLKDMIAWYGDILGIHPGPRPDFAFDGAWLYLGDNPYIHLVESVAPHSGPKPRIEHFAFNATGMTDLTEKLDTRGVAYTIDTIPGFPLVQINLRDIDGNHIHIDFSREEAEAAGLV